MSIYLECGENRKYGQFDTYCVTQKTALGRSLVSVQAGEHVLILEFAKIDCPSVHALIQFMW